MTQQRQESGLADSSKASLPDTLMQAPRCVEKMMTTNVVTMYLHSLFREVVDVLAKNPSRHLLVADMDGRLVGVISDRDVLRAADGYDWETTFAANVMTVDPITVTADTPLSTATTLVLDNRVNCLPVVDELKRVRGILTTTDLIQAFQKIQMSLEQLPTASS